MTEGHFPQLFPDAELEEIARFHEAAAQTWGRAGGRRGREIADMHLQRAAAARQAIAVYCAAITEAVGAVDEMIASIEGIKAVRDSVGKAS